MGGTVMDSPASALLAELVRQGIQLQAHGDRLRYKPRDALTGDLAERVKANKAELLALLQEAGPRTEAARMLRQVRRAGDSELAIALRDAWRERVAICEIDGGLSREDAEAEALTETVQAMRIQATCQRAETKTEKGA